MQYTDYDGSTQDTEDTTCHSGLDQGELGYVSCEGDGRGHAGKHWGAAWANDDGTTEIMLWTGGETIAGDLVPCSNVEHRPATDEELATLKRHAEEFEAAMREEHEPYRMIEPSHGATYDHPGEWAVYEYGAYEESSVLAGQEKRSHVEGGFTTPEEAKLAYPDAEVSESSAYVPRHAAATPPEWFDPANAGESWLGD